MPTPPSPAELAARPLVLFDGVCGLCHGFVAFAIRRDRHDRLRFAPLQGSVARQVLGQAPGASADLSAVVCIVGAGEAQPQVHREAAAVLTVLHQLGGPWRLVAWLGGLLPETLAAWAYKTLAARRYRLFGKLAVCPVPTAAERHKFYP